MTDHAKSDEAVQRLTRQQYAVTQEGATEPPFNNEHWDNKEPGLYVDDPVDQSEAGRSAPNMAAGRCCDIALREGS